jgi:diguanylate cyclase (GGDEF)-like protein
VTYPIPGNEIERLATLQDYRILDSEFDSRFDNLTQIASAHFGLPIALVSLVDADRQWFKSMVGLDVRQTPRKFAFCTHAITRPDSVMVVEDAARDERFAANPLVTGDPHIRFYAGAPILAEDGAALGTVCVIDRAPRQFDDADRRMLKRLAENAQTLMDLHRRNSLLREAARRDALTGLLNRRGLDKAIDLAIDASLSGEGCGLLYLDLDHFKHVNDTYGHETGDSVLKETARRLQSVVRQGDLVARIGGDEFVVLLAHPVNAGVLDLVAQRIVRACAMPIVVHEQVIELGMSVGGALAPRDAVLSDDLLREADRALYEAKRGGRGRVAIAGPRSLGVPGNENAPDSELALAIERDDLFLEWQSCHDLATGAIHGYEALVRWQHPQAGVISPANFVPLAEACGLAGRLDAWVLFKACEQGARAPGNVRISVNLSALSIANGIVVPLVRSALERSGLDPGRLVLEITESAAIGNEDNALAHMQELKALGLKLALDDFGTGYASLAYLHRYPFDMLKLDQKFVAGLAADPRAMRLSQGVIHLARLLDIAVVAEGIETSQQAELLQVAGCTMGQGYLWARPSRLPWET